jgi:hypothetical protein
MAKELISDRCTLASNSTSINIQVHSHDSAEKKPLTRKVPGRLVDISTEGACLETSQTLIDGYHPMLHDDIDGETPIGLDMPASREESPFTLPAKVLWYNRIPGETHFHFHAGIKFIEVSAAEKKHPETLLRAAIPSPKA